MRLEKSSSWLFVGLWLLKCKGKKNVFFTRRLNSHRDFPTDVGCKGGYSRKVLKQNCKLLYYVCIRQRLLQIYQTTSVVTGAIAEAACQNWFVLSWQSQQEDFFQNEVFTSRAEDTLPFYCLFEWNNFFFSPDSMWKFHWTQCNLHTCDVLGNICKWSKEEHVSLISRGLFF